MEENNAAQPELITALMNYLDCPCRYFPPSADDGPVMEAYHEAQERGKKEGFIPMLVTADETLWECLIMNSDDNDDGHKNYGFDAARVSEYRTKMLAAPLEKGSEVAAMLIQTRQEEAEEDGFDWDEEVMGEIADGEVINKFCGYWSFYEKETVPLVLAEIPVKNPWEIFAWLPFGGWNECPDTPELMAVVKYWYELYGAVPAVMTHDVLEFETPAPADSERALQLALEQYAWCPDVVDQNDFSVGMLADTLTKSTVWYFWWD